MTDTAKDQGPRRRPTGIARRLIWVTAVGLSSFHLYTAFYGVLSPLHQRSIHLLGLMIISFLAYKLHAGASNLTLSYFDWLLTLVSVGLGIYFLWAFRPDFVLERGIMGINQTEVWMGLLLMAIILEGARRTVGLPIVLVALAFLAYGLFGPYLPDFLAHKGYSLSRLVSYLV